MSSLAGEQALKDGIVYESAWAILFLVRLMEERLVLSVQLGGAPREAGIDFRVTTDTRVEHYQVKRAAGTRDRWTLDAIQSEGVLSNFKHWLLDNPTAHCHFVSQIPSVELGHLADRARRSGDSLEDFLGSYVNDTAHSRSWKNLCSKWACEETVAWRLLKRVWAHPASDELILSHIHSSLGYQTADDPVTTTALLAKYCLTAVHQVTTPDVLWAWLAEKGVRRLPRVGDQSVLSALRAQTARFMAGVEKKLMIHPPLPRQIATDMVAAMEQSSGGADLILLGEPGGGKSAVIYQIAEMAMQRRWPVLAFGLDRLPAMMHASGLKEALDLPTLVDHALRLAAEGTSAVLLIDQLDAVSQYSGRTGTLIDYVTELISTVRVQRATARIHVVLACRGVDWRHQGELRRLHSKHDAKEPADGVFTTVPWSNEDIDSVLRAKGIKVSAFTASQRAALLARPQYLALVVDVCPADEDIPPLVTPKQLFEAYWDKKVREFTSGDHPIHAHLWEATIRTMVTYLDGAAVAISDTAPSDYAPLSVPSRCLSRFQPGVDRMVSGGVLALEKGRYRFGHESFYDYCFARFFDERGVSLLDFVLATDQTLEVRGQVRQVIAHWRDDSRDYMNAVRSLLNHTDVRFHIKQLVAIALCEQVEPRAEEWETLMPFVDDELSPQHHKFRSSLRTSLFTKYAASRPLVLLSIKSGWMAEKLQSSDAAAVSSLFWVLRRHQNGAQNEVWGVIQPLLQDKRFASNLDQLAAACDVAQSRETFEWIIGMMRTYVGLGDAVRENHKFHGICDDLAKNRPEWLGEWVAAVIDARVTAGVIHRCDLVPQSLGHDADFAKAAKAAPSEFLGNVLPAIIQAGVAGAIDRIGTWSRSGSVRPADDPHRDPDERLFDALVEVLQINDELANAWLDRLLEENHEATTKIYTSVLCADVPHLSERAASFLLTGERALASTERYTKLAVPTILKWHFGRFSHARALAVECSILNYFPKWQTKRFQDGAKVERVPRCTGTYHGYNQMHFLRAIPEGLRSKRVVQRLAEWERKFGSHSNQEKRLRSSPPTPIPKALKSSPEQHEKALVKTANRRKRMIADVEDHVQGVARDAMIEQVRRDPSPFIAYLRTRGPKTKSVFVAALSEAVESSCKLSEAQAWEAIQAFHALGSKHLRRASRLFEFLSVDSINDEAVSMLISLASTLPIGNESRASSNDDDKVDQLESRSYDSTAGQALRTLQSFLWEKHGFVERVRANLPRLMIVPDASLRALTATVCHSIARHPHEEAYAVQLFESLATHNVPDDLVLASRWPFEFIRCGLREHMSTFAPILARMNQSSQPAVREAGARLTCIAIVLGEDVGTQSVGLITSEFPEARAACAAVAGANLNIMSAREWCQNTLLLLADDDDASVRMAVGQSFRHDKALDVAGLGDWILRYIGTRAFLTSPRHFLEALEHSKGALPETMIEVVRAILSRAGERDDSCDDSLGYHMRTIGTLVKRLYVENRDRSIRCEVLNLIDTIYAQGEIDEEAFD